MTPSSPPALHQALIVAHAHPDFSKGGAEVAAQGLYRGLNLIDGWQATLLAGHRLSGLSREDAPIRTHRRNAGGGDELLFDSQTDAFFYDGLDGPARVNSFRSLLEKIRPDVVHFHHYWNVGLDLILAVKRLAAGIPVLLTLHEYLAICLRDGQMLKTSGELCRGGSPSLCHACLPRHNTSALFLREHYLKSVFANVDRFIAPSGFLKQRYVDWGLPAERIAVLENGQRGGAIAPRPRNEPQRRRDRFGFFGQITPYKGLDLLMEAFEMLPEPLAATLHLEVHGGLATHLPETYRQRIDTLFARSRPGVQHHGPYAAEELSRLIQEVDWVVVPSIWWENSPMVIQEAFLHGRPVICADIGGMAEKVRDGTDGLHFRARSARDLARQIEHAATSDGLWEHLASAINRPPSLEESALAHVRQYSDLLARSWSTAPVTPLRPAMPEPPLINAPPSS